jgi:hypothetical protein
MKTSINTVLILALLCVASCLASVKNTSTASSCPVRITQAYFLGSRGIERTFYLSYLNQSEKIVIGAKFGFDLLDGVGDFHPYASDLTTSRKTKVGKRNLNTTFAIYDNPDAGMRVYAKKVAFDDGTTWTDDGSMRCQYAEDSRRR